MSEPSVKFSLSCDEVIVDKTEKVSLIGIFENIYSGNFPAIHPKFAIITKWTNGLGKHRIQIKLLDSNKQTISQSKEREVDFKENIDHNDILYLRGVNFKNEGVYLIQSFVNGKLVHEERLNVRKVKKE